MEIHAKPHTIIHSVGFSVEQLAEIERLNRKLTQHKENADDGTLALHWQLLLLLTNSNNLNRLVPFPNLVEQIQRVEINVNKARQFANKKLLETKLNFFIYTLENEGLILLPELVPGELYFIAALIHDENVKITRHTTLAALYGQLFGVYQVKPGRKYSLRPKHKYYPDPK